MLVYQSRIIREPIEEKLIPAKGERDPHGLRTYLCFWLLEHDQKSRSRIEARAGELMACASNTKTFAEVSRLPRFDFRAIPATWLCPARYQRMPSFKSTTAYIVTPTALNCVPSSWLGINATRQCCPVRPNFFIANLSSLFHCHVTVRLQMRRQKGSKG
jgi:hypothetical protein